MNKKPSLALKIKELRKKRKITLAEVAAFIGCDESTVSRWENGKTIPIPICERKIAEFIAIETGKAQECL